MKTVLCYGDSNTFGYDPVTTLRYPETVRWPGRLRTLLGDEYRVIEEGCNGRTTVFSDEREPWKSGLYYLRPCLNSHKPLDLVIFMLGSNDLKEDFHASAAQIAQGAGTLVRVTQEFTQEKQGYVPKILLVSPPEIGEGILSSPFRDAFTGSAVTRSREFPALYRQTAERYGCASAAASDWVEPSREDSLHLTAEAHERLAAELAKVVRELLPS